MRRHLIALCGIMRPAQCFEPRERGVFQPSRQDKYVAVHACSSTRSCGLLELYAVLAAVVPDQKPSIVRQMLLLDDARTLAKQVAERFLGIVGEDIVALT
jgi:hypothetical protein